MAVITDQGVSTSVPLNMQNCSHGAGMLRPIERTEREKASMFLSFIYNFDELAKFPPKVLFFFKLFLILHPYAFMVYCQSYMLKADVKVFFSTLLPVVLVSDTDM